MTTLRPLLGALLLCASAICAGQGTAAPPAGVFTVSTNNTPLDRRALQLLGTEVFRRVGLDLQLKSLPSERSLFAADAGEVDGEGLRIAGIEARYPNLVRVPERFIGISFVAFARDDSIQLEKGWDSLSPHRLAFINGWKMFEAKTGQARVVHKVEQAEQMFRMLAQGRIDLALYTLADGNALVRSLGLEGVRAVRPPLADVDMFLYLHRRHEALAPRLAQALRDIKADGTHARIMGGLDKP